MRISTMFRAALVAMAALALPLTAHAQTVTQLPQFVAPSALLDVGNGPLEFRMLTGSMAIATSQSSGTSGNATSSSTTVTITGAAPATPPCVGCQISGTGVTSGTTVSAITGTSITLSAAMTIATSTTLSWGAACPAAPPTAPVALVQASVGADLPFYTQARICAYGVRGPGGQFLTFAIGAH